MYLLLVNFQMRGAAHRLVNTAHFRHKHHRLLAIQDCTVMSLCSPAVQWTPKTYSTSHNRKALDQSDGSSAGAVDMLPVPHVERSLLSAWLTAEILCPDQGADYSSQSRTPLKTCKENYVNFSGRKCHIGKNQCSSQIGPV